MNSRRREIEKLRTGLPSAGAAETAFMSPSDRDAVSQWKAMEERLHDTEPTPEGYLDLWGWIGALPSADRLRSGSGFPLSRKSPILLIAAC